MRASGVRQSLAWSSRLRRPESERSTTASWKTTLDTLRASIGLVLTAWPASLAEPLVVVSIPIVVDLPAPFGPSNPNTSPGSTSNEMPFTASTPSG